jgi:hypothetical protein
MKVLLKTNLETGFYGELKVGKVYDLYNEDATKYIDDKFAVVASKDSEVEVPRNTLLKESLKKMSEYNKIQLKTRIALNMSKFDREDEKEAVKIQLTKKYVDQFEEFKDNIEKRQLKEK